VGKAAPWRCSAACANVANLLLSQAALRVKEVGIRSALGASKARLVLQFLAEPLALALVGATLGVGVAWVGIRLFNDAIASTNPPFWLEFKVDPPVLLFVLGVTLFSTLASGVLPALRAASGNTGEILKDESRGASSFRLGRISRALVVFEIALSCGLLVAAGLMIKSVAKLRTIDFGFATEQVFTARVGLPESDYPEEADQVRFFDELQKRLSALPAVESVALSDALPGVGSAWGPLAVEGAAYATERDYPNSHRVVVGPGSFQAFGTSLLQGRDFGAQDREGSLPVAIVYFVDTLAGRIAQNTWFYRVFGTIFMVMGFVALFLAAIGLYGVMAFSVSRRTREMGVRMALGAQARDVVGLVLRQGAFQLVVGLALGLVLAAGAAQLLAIILFQVQPRDPGVFASIVGVLTLTGVLASWIPARRATRVDPMVALRTD
jgi:hypothetical protein